jgi:hypothetical protein
VIGDRTAPDRLIALVQCVACARDTLRGVHVRRQAFAMSRQTCDAMA